MTDISLISNPNLTEFEIVKFGISTFPTLTIGDPGAGNYNSGEAVTTIAHNLGYVPPFMAFMQFSSKNYTVPFTFMTGSSNTASWEIYQMYVDITNIYLLTDLNVYHKAVTAGGTDHLCKYYLLRDRARA